MRAPVEIQADYELEMAWCARIVREAADMLHDANADAAAQLLEFEMTQERLGLGPAEALLGRSWVRHVDEHVVSLALVDDKHGPLISAVCRPATDELLCGARGLGAFLQCGDSPCETAPAVGLASSKAHVVHVPHNKCPELEMAMESLAEKMPVDITRVPCCCCCEGLFELVSGRADMHLSPPEYCLTTEPTPVPVLCAFEVLLSESGGSMSDVLGNDIDLVLAMERGAHTSGVLASETGTLNYMLHAIKPSFEAERLVLPRLADLQGGVAHLDEPLRNADSSAVRRLERLYRLPSPDGVNFGEDEN